MSATEGPLFRVLCPTCGYLEVSAARIRLVLAEQPGGSFYTVRCPGCERSVRKPAGRRIVQILTERGVPAMRVHAS